MNDLSILIGGKAGFGIDISSLVIAHILNQLGYRIYIYRDYPSLIRGGHTFSIIRASDKTVASHHNKVDFCLALNQDTVNFHIGRLKENSVVIYDSNSVKSEGIGVPIGNIIKEENASEIMRNSCIVGSFAKAAGIGWDVLEQVLKKHVAKEIDLNLKVASRGYNEPKEVMKIDTLSQQKMPILSGNEAIGLGLIKAGLKTYVAYPMTPASGLLHFMASGAGDFGLKVIHPESEIGVILMALGFAYAGEKVAVGTSGGGFCLMTEGLSFSGMAELPIVILVGQRPGPSTGLPTYTSQTELNFVLNAGQGEFPRFVVAPGDVQEAYYWSSVALNVAWKYQMPSIILSDKTLSEGIYSFDIDSAGEAKEWPLPLWNKEGSYKRYSNTENGVSALTFAPDKDAIVKVNSYEHDEFGIAAEDPKTAKLMQEKRLRKGDYLAQELQGYDAVKTYANPNSSTALLCWGSNKGVCVEAAERLGIRVIHPIVLWPLPAEQLKKAAEGVENLICVENNATGQLANLVGRYGFKVNAKVLRYDGRPFSVDELYEELKKVLK